MRLFSWLESRLDKQRGALFPWSAVLFAAGIAIYFDLSWEPGPSAWLALTGFAMAIIVLLSAAPTAIRTMLIAALLLVSGFACAGFRAHNVADIILPFRYYGPVEGRIVAIDRSASDAVRLTLDRVRLSDVRDGVTPGRIRIALHGSQGFLKPEPGMTIIATAHLSPPSGAVEPGGYDFRRQAWFEGLGAVGYARSPVLAIAPHAEQDISVEVYRLRMRISSAVHSILPPPAGGFAAAITTGDRSGIDQSVLEALRASNLAHLLAISGLHMGLLTAFVFATLRFGLVAIPRIALTWPVRKLAAAGALIAGSAYLGLSGGNVATERAFIMVSVMFCAILAERRAITLRSVAIAALIVLTLRPEALYGPGFQMSFAATTALVAVYGTFSGTSRRLRRAPLWLNALVGVSLSSFVAGMATAPIAAAHFNVVPHYGLIANILSVPLMGAVIIPAAVLAACLAPFGGAWIGLMLMEWRIMWILEVATTVASWPSAVSPIKSPAEYVLPILSLGALCIALATGRERLLGLPLIALSLLLWGNATRPFLLISESGGLVGVMTPYGRALSKAKGDGFAAKVWLENDGDPVRQEDAHARWQSADVGAIEILSMGKMTLVHATGKKNAGKALEFCSSDVILVVNVSVNSEGDCEIYDAARLRQTGSISMVLAGNQLKIVTARQESGTRLWTQ